jgi:hypothetical protein
VVTSQRDVASDRESRGRVEMMIHTSKMSLDEHVHGRCFAGARNSLEENELLVQNVLGQLLKNLVGSADDPRLAREVESVKRLDFEQMPANAFLNKPPIAVSNRNHENNNNSK